MARTKNRAKSHQTTPNCTPNEYSKTVERSFLPYTKVDTKAAPLFGVQEGSKVTPNRDTKTPVRIWCVFAVRFVVLWCVLCLFVQQDGTHAQKTLPSLRRPYQASEDPTKPQKTLSSLRRPYQASEDPTIGAVTGREVNAHQKERGLFWCCARCPKETFGVLDAHQKRHTKRTPKIQQSTPKTPNSKLAHRSLV